jgi:hypothetical protein
MSTPANLEVALNSMERVEPQTPEPAPAVPPAAPEPPAALNVEDDAAVDAAIQVNAIQVPDGEALIPSSDVGKVAQSYRAQLKAVKTELANAKEGSAKIPQLEQQIAQLTQAVQQMQPYVQAYQQIAAQPQTPVAPKEPEIPDHEAEQYARTYDLYKPDGSGQLDLDRGRKIVTDMRRIAKEAATEAARSEVAPIQQQTVQAQAKHMLDRAKNTVLPNGAKVDASMLEYVWSRVPAEVTSTPEGAQQAFLAALGYTVGMAKPEQMAEWAKPQPARGQNGQFQAAAAPIPEPVPRETSGGQPPNAPTQLTDAEQKFLSQTGMSEADYLKVAGARYGGR